MALSAPARETGGATPELSAATLYDHPAFWPPRARLVEPVGGARDETKLKAGEDAVFIRLDPGDPPNAVLDFGRKGLRSVSLERTDVLERARAIASGEEKKTYANWTMMLGRGFADPERDGKKVPLHSLKQFERLLTVHVTDLDPMAETLKDFLDRNEAFIERTKTLPVVFPRDLHIASSEYAKRMRENGLSVYYMLPFLCEPYARTLDLPEERFPAAHLTDVDGKSLQLGGQGGPFEEQLRAVETKLRELAGDAHDSGASGNGREEAIATEQ